LSQGDVICYALAFQLNACTSVAVYIAYRMKQISCFSWWVFQCSHCQSRAKFTNYAAFTTTFTIS